MGKGKGLFGKVFSRKGSKRDDSIDGSEPAVGDPVATELPVSARPDPYPSAAASTREPVAPDQAPGYRGLPSDPAPGPPSGGAAAPGAPASPVDKKAADRERGRALAVELKTLRETTVAQEDELKKLKNAIKSSAQDNQAIKERWNLQNFKYHLLLDMWALRVLDQDQDDMLSNDQMRQSLEDARHRSIEAEYGLQAALKA